METFSIVDILLSFTTKWNKHIDVPMYDGMFKKVVKYKPFLAIDKDVYKSIMRKVFTC